MKISLFVVVFVCCYGFIIANKQTTGGLSFSFKAANPDSYYHTSGGGSFYYGVDTLMGDYYACESDIASVFLKITTDNSFSFSTEDEISINLYPKEHLELVGVENNCGADASICKGDTNVEVSVTSNTLTLTGLESNVVVVVRLDFTIGCKIECGCKCFKQNDGRWGGVCPSTSLTRQTHLSTATKRDIQYIQEVLQECETFGTDGYNVVVYLNQYTVNDDETFSVPLKYITFSNLCGILVCQDYTGCYVGSVTEVDSETSYKDRTCEFTEVSCDDGDDSTEDYCVPPERQEENVIIPPNCVHNQIDEVQQENLNYALSKQEQGGLSSTVLGGVIAGSVIGIVAIAMVIVLIYKKFQQVPMKEDPIEGLKVPLN